jgi:hypothetical protein
MSITSWKRQSHGEAANCSWFLQQQEAIGRFKLALGFAAHLHKQLFSSSHHPALQAASALAHKHTPPLLQVCL